MSEFDAVDLVRDTLIQTLILAAPILGAGLLVGLVISLFQAVTQIQEQTLTFVPKIIVMIVVSVALLSWLVVEMVDFTMTMISG